MIIIPDQLRHNTVDTCGSEGVAWLERLPEIIGEVEQRWSVQAGEPFPRLSYNYAAPAQLADGTAAVLKLFPPGDSEFGSQTTALRLYDGSGITRLFASDPHLGALLLERAAPGTPLHTLRDEAQEMAVAAAIMKQLWRPVPEDHVLPTVADWGLAFERHRQAFDGGSGPLPPSLFELGESLHHDLDAASTERVLLHGDFHHDNILAAQRQSWLAIDPKGLVGDPAYEIGPLLLNLWEDIYDVPDPETTIINRVDLLQRHLGFTRERIRDWGIARALLSAVWSTEDHGSGWETAVFVAETLATQ
jgi:streptomycin 6-kinase